MIHQSPCREDAPERADRSPSQAGYPSLCTAGQAAPDDADSPSAGVAPAALDRTFGGPMTAGAARTALEREAAGKSRRLEPRRWARCARGRLTAEEVTKLVESAAGGNQHAWNALVDEFGGLIWSIARAHGFRDARAADVAQATWLRLLENLPRLKDPARVGAWLATTARRECLRLLRDNERYRWCGEDAPEHESLECPPGEALFISETTRCTAVSRACGRATRLCYGCWWRIPARPMRRSRPRWTCRLEVSGPPGSERSKGCDRSSTTRECSTS
jgi:hypothetical protein